MYIIIKKGCVTSVGLALALLLAGCGMTTTRTGLDQAATPSLVPPAVSVTLSPAVPVSPKPIATPKVAPRAIETSVPVAPPTVSQTTPRSAAAQSAPPPAPKVHVTILGCPSLVQLGKDGISVGNGIHVGTDGIFVSPTIEDQLGGIDPTQLACMEARVKDGKVSPGAYRDALTKLLQGQGCQQLTPSQLKDVQDKYAQEVEKAFSDSPQMNFVQPLPFPLECDH